MTAPPPDLPPRLAKHTVRYADHRSVNRQDLTPMMRHYVETKDQHPQAILFYRVGDFFETFFQDAVTIARELELTLTGKHAGEEVGQVPLAGVPHHALDRYCSLLVERGYAVAVCDQAEDPALAQGLVKREVMRVVTPGTVLAEGMLPARRNNFLAAVVITGNHWGLAYADISTGEFWATQADLLDGLTGELTRLQPAEVLFPSPTPDLVGLWRPGEGTDHLLPCLPSQFCYTLRPQEEFRLPRARDQVLSRFQLRSLEGIGCGHLPLAVRAAGGLLNYLQDTQRQTQVPLQLPRTYILTDYLILDYQTRRNLEITQTVRDGSFSGSLLWALDKTVTAMGGRALRRWLLQPLLAIPAIEARQATIAELIADNSRRQSLQQQLTQIYDLERLAGRAGSGTANGRDLVGLASSLIRLSNLASLVQGAETTYLQALQQVPPALTHLGERLRAHLVESPPLHLKEGNLIRPGVHPQLDEKRRQVVEDQQWIADLEVRERQRTGISTLKVNFTKAFGYYISVSRTKASQVPTDYIRKQTLTQEERYITPDLKEREARIFTAQADIQQLEYEIFTALRQEAADQADLIRDTAQAVAAVDVLCALAELALAQDYCRPRLVPGREINLQAGRHPVVEQTLPAGLFVPNSTYLGEQPNLIVLTGPNASGKSCYLRQVGLIQLLAQVGSFVPAQSATLGICDRIFTRVGAVDDLATGQSTFMVEMNETANILNHATAQSLVLLDEIGRGTATFDGLSIAWAVAEHLALTIQARTIFATHYHELNELTNLLPTVANYQVTVQELPDQIVFLHRVQPGGAQRSYGIEAGRLAGLPPQVISRARQVLRQIERHSKISVGLRRIVPSGDPQEPVCPPEQLQIFEQQSGNDDFY